ncbi:MAG: hypothetical protein R3346_04240 [Candidatus Spechtbacterales bacterium]|nr:hypothetical protein [Candidatus Spechtbacterales bacterium]
MYTGVRKSTEYQFICPKTKTKQRSLLTDNKDIIFLEDNGAKVVYLFSFRCHQCKSVVEIIWKKFCIYIDREEEKAWTEYECPRKQHKQIHPIGLNNIEALLPLGPTIKHLNTKNEPPLNLDDLIDLHLLLEKDAWFEELSEGINIDPT